MLPAALSRHHAHLMFHAQKRAEHICVEHGGIALRRLLSDRARMALSAGIIDGDIEPPETLDGLIYQAPHFLVMSNIGAHEFGLCAKRAELFDQICARIAVPTETMI